MNAGGLYRLNRDLSFVEKGTDVVWEFPKDTILTCVECKRGFGGEECFFFWNNKIFYRQIYMLDEWLAELNHEL